MSGSNFAETHVKLEDTMAQPRGALERSHSHHSTFELDKLLPVDFTLRRTPRQRLTHESRTQLLQGLPLATDRVEVAPVCQARYLGVLHDLQLSYKAHFAQALVGGQ